MKGHASRRHGTRNKKRRGVILIGKGHFNLPPGKRGVSRIRLTKVGKKLLRRAGRRGLRVQLRGFHLKPRIIRLKPKLGKRRLGTKRHSKGRRHLRHRLRTDR